MKSKFNFKSVSRALALSLCLFASSKSFAMDAVDAFLGVAVPADTHQAATVKTYGADDALLHEIDVRALPNDVAQIFGDMTVARHDRYLSLSGHSSKLECSANDFSVLVRGTFSRIGTMRGANVILNILGNIVFVGDVGVAAPFAAAAPAAHMFVLGADWPVGIDLPPPPPGPVFLHGIHIPVPGLFPAPLGAALEDDASSVDADLSDED